MHYRSPYPDAVIPEVLGLEAAIEWHVQEFAGWSGCACQLDLRIGALPPDRERDIAVFRILQEALTNVARHARATKVTVRAWTDGDTVALDVEDDGQGIPEDKLSSPHSLGIIGMRERAERLDGTMRVSTRSPGSLVALRLPVGKAAFARADAS